MPMWQRRRTPEENLVIAVIYRAVADHVFEVGKPEEQISARIFIEGEGLELYCELLGWDAEWCRRRIARAKRAKPDKAKLRELAREIFAKPRSIGWGSYSANHKRKER